MEIFFRVAGPLCGTSPHKGQWLRALMFSLICLNTQLSKQSWGWWFKTPSCSLWRHCYEIMISVILPQYTCESHKKGCVCYENRPKQRYQTIIKKPAMKNFKYIGVKWMSKVSSLRVLYHHISSSILCTIKMQVSIKTYCYSQPNEWVVLPDPAGVLPARGGTMSWDTLAVNSGTNS